ncbi:DSS1/SEM1 family-domain-containing protein [Syncephalis pseudoplumigaleata]|uniref:26S proteasome complex subunit SEM1 n=1 Tax=Syncephalis pseudoplumigaleata TaxID=1712513 RepID=A0A4P9Z4U3_9FUNG|nr:DSS1/SEM1 family-domain-containing protein [Syncephalis pseudoplumigaleata]|eukprot:RKP27614.1 DSS1/SEM1 family-domain-containing protein [Syncephalis pseudoplumigaleata]
MHTWLGRSSSPHHHPITLSLYLARSLDLIPALLLIVAAAAARSCSYNAHAIAETMSAQPTTTATAGSPATQDEAATADKTTLPQLGALEEDDEFEEFAAEDWNRGEEDAEDQQLWEDNWDDDDVEDEFAVQLRNELSKVSAQPQAMAE